MIDTKTLEQLGFRQDDASEWRAKGVEVLVYRDGYGYAIDLYFPGGTAARLLKPLSFQFDPFDPVDEDED